MQFQWRNSTKNTKRDQHGDPLYYEIGYDGKWIEVDGNSITEFLHRLDQLEIKYTEAH